MKNYLKKEFQKLLKVKQVETKREVSKIDVFKIFINELTNEEKKQGLNILMKNIEHKYIFHGGCLSCNSQSQYGIERCKGCQYFSGDWAKPDLSIK